jgi:citronellol/citronellal dehydrogenase
MVQNSRIDTIMGDAAYEILTAKSTSCTGNFFIDEEVLREAGVKDFAKYRVDPKSKEEDLVVDFFIEEIKN